MNYSKMKKVSIMILAAFFLLFSLCFVVLQETNIKAYANDRSTILLAKAQQHDLKIKSYAHEATIDENFEDDKVIVILNHQYSSVNGKVSLSDFNIANTKFNSVSDMYRVNDYVRTDKQRENFRQILSLELKEKGKGNVLKAINELEQLENVLLAQPSYIYDVSDDWIPSDPFYELQWGLNGSYGVQASDAWNVKRGNISNIKAG